MKRLLRGLVLSAILIAASAVACRVFYFGERAVATALGSMPGVRVQSVWGSADLIPKWFYAKIDVTGASGAYLYKLTRESFDQNGNFCFFQVGEYAVRYTAFGTFWGPDYKAQATLSNAFCFDKSGRDSHGLDLFPVSIRNVRDFVQNIRVVQRTLERWPRCPEFKDLTGADGRYRVCTNPDVSTDTWPPQDGWEK